jgi:lysophospholipase L1-like esterase
MSTAVKILSVGKQGPAGPAGAAGATGATGAAGSNANVTAATVLTAMDAMTPTQQASARGHIAAASAADMKALRFRACGTRGNIYVGNPAQLAVQTATSSFDVKLTDAVSDIRVGMMTTAGSNTMTVKASLVVGSVIYPLHFNGARTSTLAARGMLWTDPLGIRLAKGTTVKVRIYADAGSGFLLSFNGSNFSAGAAGIWNSSDQTDAASPPGFTATTGINLFTVSMLIGRCDNPCLALIGDSNTYGAGSDNPGWPTLAFGTTTANGPHAGLNANLLFLPKSGVRAVDWLANEFQIQGMLQYADVALVALGTNDIGTGQSAAQAQASLQAIYNDLAARGLRVWGATLPPLTTSTDSWATTGNQTASDGGKIAALNDWIRTTPAPLIGYAELSDVLSTGRNSGIWKAPGYTTDGTHLTNANQTIRELAAAAIPADILTRYPSA